MGLIREMSVKRCLYVWVEVCVGQLKFQFTITQDKDNTHNWAAGTRDFKGLHYVKLRVLLSSQDAFVVL